MATPGRYDSDRAAFRASILRSQWRAGLLALVLAWPGIGAGCIEFPTRVPESERCKMGAPGACTPDVCAVYEPDEVPAGCLGDASEGSVDAANQAAPDMLAEETPADSLTDWGPVDASPDEDTTEHVTGDVGQDAADDTSDDDVAGEDGQAGRENDVSTCDPPSPGCPCEFLGLHEGVCAAGVWAQAGDSCGPPPTFQTDETLCDGLDNDCDGVTDGGCPCVFLDDPEGVCATATLDLSSGACGPPLPFEATETLCDGLDNDCDGATDEGCPCQYQGDPDGVCVAAVNDASGACLAAGYEVTEASCDGLDNDCDGVTDEVCTTGFALVPAGTFTMGSPQGELGRHAAEEQHEVTLTRAFYLHLVELTQGQWKVQMGNSPANFDGCGTDCPVEQVSWWDAVAYANALSAAQGLPQCYTLEGCTGTAGVDLSCTGLSVNVPSGSPYDCTGYRLPTEAEWEYAYRAGTTTAFFNGDISVTDCGIDPNLDAIGWYCGNAGEKTHGVSQKNPNAWGLYDMAGNVAEWTWDPVSTYPSEPVTDPIGVGAGDVAFRAVRGGSWFTGASYARAANQLGADPAGHAPFIGFRLARTAP